MEQYFEISTFNHCWIFREKQHYQILSPEITSPWDDSGLTVLLRNTDEIDLISKYEKALPDPETIIFNRRSA